VLDGVFADPTSVAPGGRTHDPNPRRAPR
jgi:hypothetical protein